MHTPPDRIAETWAQIESVMHAWTREQFARPGATTFGLLREGERFRFQPEQTDNIKGARGWYRDALTHRAYRTGAGTLVFRVSQPQED